MQIADDVEATNNDFSNTSQSEESEDKTEEDAIADDVDVAVDPIPENRSRSPSRTCQRYIRILHRR